MRVRKGSGSGRGRWSRRIGLGALEGRSLAEPREVAGQRLSTGEEARRVSPYQDLAEDQVGRGEALAAQTGATWTTSWSALSTSMSPRQRQAERGPRAGARGTISWATGALALDPQRSPPSMGGEAELA